jgi:predicted ester cyclase
MPQTPLQVYRRFQQILLTGDYAHLGDVADIDRNTESFVGLTGRTTGLQVALRNFQTGIGSNLSEMEMLEDDVIETDDTLVRREHITATRSGPFLGVAPTGKRVTYDAVDMFRIADERIVWRYLLCDWGASATNSPVPSKERPWPRRSTFPIPLQPHHRPTATLGRRV